MKKFLSTLAVVSVAAITLASCTKKTTPTTTTGGAATTTTGGAEATSTAAKAVDLGEVNIWCSEIDGVADIMKTQAEKWLAANNYTATIVCTGIGEGDAAGKVLEDQDAAADIYCFAQDQLARLVANNAIMPVNAANLDAVVARNNAAGISNSTVGDTVYAFPLTSDNGYILMYDKSVMGDTDMTSLEAIIAKCEETQTLFSFNLTNVWYSAGFFFAEDSTGTDLCASSWKTDSDGNFTDMIDTFNSANGVIALKGMYKLLSSTIWQDSATATDFSAATPSSVVVTGSWEKNNAVTALGDNYGATILPKFTVDGQSYQLGSFSGCKLMGVKYQDTAERATAMQSLASFLSDEETQTMLFDQFGWGGTNKNLASTDAFKEDITISSLVEQANHAVPQGNILGAWWTIGNAIATNAKATDGSDDALKGVLQTYYTDLSNAFTLSSATAPLWAGANQGWNNADATSILDGEEGNYSITITFDAETTYCGGRLVKVASWDLVAGWDQLDEASLALMNADYASTDANGDRNLVFAEAGTYTITWNGTVLHAEKVTA